MAQRALVRFIAHCFLAVFVCALVPKDLYHGCVHEHESSAQPAHGYASVAASEICGLCDLITPVLFPPSIPTVLAVREHFTLELAPLKGATILEAYADRDARGPPAVIRVTLA